MQALPCHVVFYPFTLDFCFRTKKQKSLFSNKVVFFADSESNCIMKNSNIPDRIETILHLSQKKGSTLKLVKVSDESTTETKKR